MSEHENEGTLTARIAVEIESEAHWVKVKDSYYSVSFPELSEESISAFSLIDANFAARALLKKLVVEKCNPVLQGAVANGSLKNREEE